mmetsp:Transcript_31597/g.89713  ORF Transcript_31597/g.89713 Transcript_31597/m.89713 type:complete len:81 (-) Transcript_31597:338-580(-)
MLLLSGKPQHILEKSGSCIDISDNCDDRRLFATSRIRRNLPSFSTTRSMSYILGGYPILHRQGGALVGARSRVPTGATRF